MSWDQATYDQAYQRFNQVSGVREPSYRRDLFGPDGSSHAWLERAQQWGIKLAGLANPASYVLVVGCGFGWIIETIVDEFSHTRIWGTDISAWIHSEKATHARADIDPLILDIDISAADAQQQFQAAGAGQQGRFDWVVSESVVETIPAVDLAAFLDNCEALLRPQGDVAHVFTGKLTDPGPGDVHDRDLGMRFRTLAEWVAERPSHYWLNVHGWELGGGV